MKLHEYIESIGYIPLAEKLNVTSVTISNWARYNHAVPPLDAFKLMALSQGALTWASIYDPFIDSFFKKNNIKRDKVGVQINFPF